MHARVHLPCLFRSLATAGRTETQNHILFDKRMAGGAGLEPATPSLGGSCPILARLPAQIFSDLKLIFAFVLRKIVFGYT